MKKMTAALCLLLIFALLAGCNGEDAAATTLGEMKTPSTAEAFAAYMESVGFTVKDATATDDLDGTASTTLLGVGEKYQLEFFIIVDEASAQRVYRYASNNYHKRVPDRTGEQELTGGNFGIRCFESGDKFYLLAQVGATVLSCAAPVECRDEVLAHAAALGYQ